MSNRRRHANVLPLASLATWILLAGFAAAAGLYYVYCKNQLHTRGGTIKALEREFAELENQNEVIRTRIAFMSSQTSLKKRRDTDKSFLAGYQEIPRDRLVVVTDRNLPNAV